MAALMVVSSADSMADLMAPMKAAVMAEQWENLLAAPKAVVRVV